MFATRLRPAGDAAIPMTFRYIPRPETTGPNGRGKEAERAWPTPPDPGDLSKRVARRRAELRLSQAQVALRAGMSLRYLEYLERYPARPSATTLRQLAAALQTTPATLLGAGAEVPPGRGCPDGKPVMEKLTSAECRRLISPGGVGRIAVSTASGPAVFPVNFAVVADTIVIRTAAGTVIEGHAEETVALEVDHVDEALCQGWSVLVRGQAHLVTHPGQLWRLREDTALWPWAGGNREVYLRIVPVKVTGRRIEVR